MEFINSGLDSFSVLIPTSLFESINERFTDNILTISERTGEILAVESGKPIFDKRNGVKIKASLTNNFASGKGLIQQLLITFSTKFLCSDILDSKGNLKALNESTMRIAYEYFQNITECYIDYNDFLDKSTVFDCDFKSDFICSDDDYKQILDKLKPFVGAKFYKEKKKNRLHKPNYSGMTFVNRSDASTSKPFVKIYSKIEELETRDDSRIWHDTYLPQFTNRYYRRIEVTIRNSDHFKSLAKKGFLPYEFTEGVSLRKLLLLSNETINRIITFSLECHTTLQNYAKSRSNTSMGSVRPTDYFLVSLCRALMDEGYSLDHVINLYDLKQGSAETQAVTKSRLRKRIEDNLEIHQKINNLTALRVTAKDAFTITKKSQ